MKVVADACVAVKWYVQEPGLEEAGLLLDAWADSIDLFAPDIFIAETLNALVKKGRAGQMTERQVQDALDHLRVLAVPLLSTSLLMDRALHLALHLDHALQDCLYLACAEHLGAAFVTADDHFSRKLHGPVSPARVVALANIPSFLETLKSRSA